VLRASGERSSGGRATKERDELPLSNVDCHSIPPRWDHARRNVSKGITTQSAGL
jgi:hypothetical protein